MAAGGYFLFSYDLAKMTLFTVKMDLNDQIMAQNFRIGEFFHFV